MTAQASDSLKFEGRWFGLSCEPLRDWLDRPKNRKNKTLRFRAASSACWRGYGARWEIARGRLYMTSIGGTLSDGSPVTPAVLFANYSKQYLDSVGANDPENAGPGTFAFWVTGLIWCSFGRLVRYEHMGYESIYEGQLHLVMKDGFLIGQRIVHREVPKKKSEIYDWEDELDGTCDEIDCE
jgi:hypothetical protein